jgi:hypothetical protein
VGAGVVSAFQVGKATVALAAIQSDLGVPEVEQDAGRSASLPKLVVGPTMGRGSDAII